MARNLIVALVDDLFFQQPLEMAAQSLGFDLAFAEPVEDLTAWLVARQPRLIVVDLAARSQDWERWVLTIKTSPATRRLPVLAFGSHTNADAIARARQTGCDAVLSNGAFKADMAGHLRAHARVDDDAELQRQSALPLPPLARQGIAEFNAGRYFEQHESLEHAWRAEPGPVRQLYQGILQVGVAYYQIQRANYDGARKMFQRARQYLEAVPDACQGVDVAALRADARAAQDALELLGPQRIAEFDPVLMRPVRMI